MSEEEFIALTRYCIHSHASRILLRHYTYVTWKCSVPLQGPMSSHVRVWFCTGPSHLHVDNRWCFMSDPESDNYGHILVSLIYHPLLRLCSCHYKIHGSLEMGADSRHHLLQWLAAIGCSGALEATMHHAMPRGCRPAEPYEHNLDLTYTCMHIDPTRTIHRHLSFRYSFRSCLSNAPTTL
jgi:hypothetical protein